MVIETTKKKKIYSDIPINLTVHPKSKDLSMVSNEEAVKRSIKNLILTDRYERPFQPDLGGNVKAMLFENFDRLTSSHVRNQLEATIHNHEPRAKVLDIKVTPSFDENGINITLTFVVTGSSRPVTLNALLERRR
jgi:phage baseplate assembly protein W